VTDCYRAGLVVYCSVCFIHSIFIVCVCVCVVFRPLHIISKADSTIIHSLFRSPNDALGGRML